MLRRATCLFMELNALDASAKSTASFSSDSKAARTACTAASIPEICPPHNWRQPDASCTSGLAMESIALAIILLAVSPMPIGRTPGCLSRAIRRQARKDETDLGSTKEVHSLFAIKARELHRSVDAPLKAVHRRLHSCASTPEGPADPVVRLRTESLAFLCQLGVCWEDKGSPRSTGTGTEGGGGFSIWMIHLILAILTLPQSGMCFLVSILRVNMPMLNVLSPMPLKMCTQSYSSRLMLTSYVLLPY